ncbi:MAG TPA: EAL domain-containing protein [Burkholderiales bacterium]|nr:EAL domain-containing protein [Burkholderiales bacterium]
MDPSQPGDIDEGLSGFSDPAARLRQSLEANEFALFCQPILALRGEGGYPMAEVLVRLREEEAALLPPGDFFPMFEHYGMMPELDRWVVRNVIKRLVAGSRIQSFTLNISAQTLQETSFPIFVGTELAKNGIAPDTVLFEIDESDTLNRLPAASRFAAAVKANGGKILIDGFGRRSVSFAALEALDPAYVKVDGGIVRKLLKSNIAATKMNAILKVAEATGMGLVAECVEEQDILTRLKALGVGYAQGFGIYQPQAIDSFAKK